LHHAAKSRYFYEIWKHDVLLWFILSITHPASRFQIYDFYDIFGTVMDVAGRISLVRVLYMSDKSSQLIERG